MIWIKIKYRFYLYVHTFLFKLGFANRLLKNRFGERIIVFHGIDETGETKYNSRFHSVQFFEKFIQYILANYNVISLEDFYAKKFKPNTLNVAITFDDGYLNNYKYAVPILEKYEVPATFFITTIQNKANYLWPDFLDLVSFYSSKNEIIFENNRYVKNRKKEFVFNGVSLKNRCKKLTFDELKSIFTIFEEEWEKIQKKPLEDYWQLMNDTQINLIAKNKLFTIGSHSYTHANLTKIPFEEAKFEILKGKEILETIGSKSIVDFAFPFGSYNLELVNYCRNIGFKRVLLVDYNSEKNQRIAALKSRFVMNPYVGFEMQILYLLKGKYV